MLTNLAMRFGYTSARSPKTKVIKAPAFEKS
jgi:hypothetical protein